MRSLVFLLEEPSAKKTLQGVLPNILQETVDVKYLVFEGKQDLEKRMARTLRAWQQPDARFIVLRDQDCGDCKMIKAVLLERCREAGREHESMVRIACRELESWFVGDWASVGKAFDLPKLAKLQEKAKYRNPDILQNPVSELRKHIPEYQKCGGAERIGPYLCLANNVSPSFIAFVAAVKRAMADDLEN